MERYSTMFASQGYIVAVQGGDADDGYDTVDWLSKQIWSNYRVGTYGYSDMAMCRFWAPNGGTQP